MQCRTRYSAVVQAEDGLDGRVQFGRDADLVGGAAKFAGRASEAPEGHVEGGGEVGRTTGEDHPAAGGVGLGDVQAVSAKTALPLPGSPSGSNRMGKRR
jgi:hypothetical protein